MTTPLRPVVYGAVNVRFVDPKANVDVTELITLAAPITDGPVPVDWSQATRVDYTPEMLEPDAPEGGAFASLAAPALKAKSYDAWTKQLTASVVVNESLELFASPSTKECSRAGESERDFRARLQHSSRESRDRAVDLLRRKYAPRQAALDEKLRRAQQAVARETEQASGQKLQTAISFGATLVGALLGRKAINVGTIGRATTAARGMGRSMKEAEDVGRARENVAAIEEQRRALDEELQSAMAALESSADAATEPLTTITVKPKKTNVSVKLVALVWTA